MVTRISRPALSLLAFLAGLIQSAIADPIPFRITPGRASHTFGIMDPGNSYPTMLGSGQFVFTLSPESDGGWLELLMEADPESSLNFYG